MTSNLVHAGELPPCRICGTKASGIHYGVNTCEACKAFFRRSCGKGHMFECPAQKSCKLTGKSRNTCAYCRYQRCMELGMCKDAIKTGRYSHELRASNIREIKGLEEKSRSSSDTDTSDVTSSLSYTTDKSLDSSSSGERKEPTVDSTVMKGIENMDVRRGSANSLSGSSGSSSSSKLYDESKVEVYEEVIEKLCGLQEAIVMEMSVRNCDEALARKEMECVEMVQLREQMFGPMKPISMDEYVKFYKETGIDVDGRRELFENSVIPLMERSIKQQIAFAKLIPGFNQLSTDDQIELIKASRMDYFLMSRYRDSNVERKVFTFHDGRIVHLSDIYKILTHTDGVDAGFNLFVRIKDLNFKPEETAVISALIIMSCDECNLENREFVEESQGFLLECLFYLIERYYAGDKLRFAKIINCLLEIRTLRECNEKFNEVIASYWHQIVNFPPMLMELMNR